MKTIEICASFTGVIPKASFENIKPFYSVKETITELDMTDEEIKDRQSELQNICYNQFKKLADASYAERIANEYRNIRFYDGKDGLKYPSVTSIIGWDKDFYMSADELNQHCARGTIIDKQVEIFLSTGEWKEPKTIPEIYPELVVLKGGNLGLELDNVNFQAFYKEYPFKVINQQQSVLNHKHKYGGRMEIKCLIESENKGKWDKIEGVLFDTPTLLDLKCTTSLDKSYVMKQNTAYAKCDEEIKQIGAIHLKKDNAKGYAKPVIETNLNKYWSLFKNDRDKFYNRYGI